MLDRKSRPAWCGALVIMAAVALDPRDATAQQNYPTQTVRIVVPQPAGGLNDISARLIQPSSTCPEAAGDRRQ